MKFCIPLTTGRGWCSTAPLRNIAQRFRQSGKHGLVILAVGDIDPDGDEIAHSAARRLRDDHNISRLTAVKAALTMDQVDDLDLPESWERAKKTSSNYQRYIGRYDTDAVYELEAIEPATLQKLLEDAIDSVIDRKAFNAEVSAEKGDAGHNAATREIVLRTLREQTGSK
jgi:hypothetical protein